MIKIDLCLVWTECTQYRATLESGRQSTFIVSIRLLNHECLLNGLILIRYMKVILFCILHASSKG